MRGWTTTDKPFNIRVKMTGKLYTHASVIKQYKLVLMGGDTMQLGTWEGNHQHDVCHQSSFGLTSRIKFVRSMHIPFYMWTWINSVWISNDKSIAELIMSRPLNNHIVTCAPAKQVLFSVSQCMYVSVSVYPSARKTEKLEIGISTHYDQPPQNW